MSIGYSKVRKIYNFQHIHKYVNLISSTVFHPLLLSKEFFIIPVPVLYEIIRFNRVINESW